jgi:hypothetical protein
MRPPSSVGRTTPAPRPVVGGIRALTLSRLALFGALTFAALAWAPAVAEDAGATPKAALAAKGFDRALLDPVDGVDLRTYAHIAFESFAGDDPDLAKILARHGIVKAQFDHANATFIERMRADATYTLANLYGAYFIETASGKYAALAADVAHSVIEGAPLREAAPMSWDDYLALTSFYGRQAPSAKDQSRASYDEILKPKGLSFVDYQIIGAWFGRRLRLQGNP